MRHNSQRMNAKLVLGHSFKMTKTLKKIKRNVKLKTLKTLLPEKLFWKTLFFLNSFCSLWLLFNGKSYSVYIKFKREKSLNKTCTQKKYVWHQNSKSKRFFSMMPWSCDNNNHWLKQWQREAMIMMMISFTLV